jgi:hypothetical protein
MTQNRTRRAQGRRWCLCNCSSRPPIVTKSGTSPKLNGQRFRTAPERFDIRRRAAHAFRLRCRDNSDARNATFWARPRAGQRRFGGRPPAIVTGFVSGIFPQTFASARSRGERTAVRAARSIAFGISFGADDGSEFRSRIAYAFYQFHDVRFRSDREVATLVHELRIDTAIDLTGHTSHSRTEMLAYRPCPIQSGISVIRARPEPRSSTTSPMQPFCRGRACRC